MKFHKKAWERFSKRNSLLLAELERMNTKLDEIQRIILTINHALSVDSRPSPHDLMLEKWLGGTGSARVALDRNRSVRNSTDPAG
jgi:hypothetical protein